jgi:hypothetical protein
MTRRIVAVLTVALVLSACGGGVDTSPLPGAAPAIQLPAGGTSLTLSAGSTTAQLSVSEAGYSGTYTAMSSNTAVAIVAPGSVQSSAASRALQAKVTSGSQGSATFTVSAVQNGSATITITDDNGHSTSFSVVVSGIASGPVSLLPVSLTFTGSAQTRSVTITDPGAQTFTVSGCSGIATLGPVANGAFTITSVAAGSCTVTVSDGFHQATVAVSVTTLGVPIQ